VLESVGILTQGSPRKTEHCDLVGNSGNKHFAEPSAVAPDPKSNLTRPYRYDSSCELTPGSGATALGSVFRTAVGLTYWVTSPIWMAILKRAEGDRFCR